jgi:hypothetical protein
MTICDVFVEDGVDDISTPSSFELLKISLLFVKRMIRILAPTVVSGAKWIDDPSFC